MEISCLPIYSSFVVKFYHEWFLRSKMFMAYTLLEMPQPYLIFSLLMIVFFCRANHSAAKKIKAVLQENQRISWQKINMDRSYMVFSPNMCPNIKTETSNNFPIKVSNNISKYLGLPAVVGRSKSQVFNFIMDRVWEKLKGWKGKKSFIFWKVSFY